MWYGSKSMNEKFHGKETVNKWYIPVFGDPDEQVSPNLDLSIKYNKALAMIGQTYLITSQSRKKKKVVGLGENLVQVGFGGTLCCELCYLK